jgi:hypothetical protein
MPFRMTIVRSDGATLTFDLVGEASAGGSVVIVQVLGDLEDALKQVEKQQVEFKYYEENDPEPIDFTGKITRMTQHNYTGRPQLQVEIQRD